MKILNRVSIPAVAALAVWSFFSWPLPVHLFSGIPSTARNTETERVRYMIPGDHLQLLYHFRLAGEMATGKIPLFHNLYEFNTGRDADRYEPGAYYIPFSLLYAALAGLGGDAFGWNVTGLLSLLFTLLFTWKLALRYVDSPPAAAVMSLISIMLPYRWVALMGGSPTGFAMALAPMLLLGLDRAVREGAISGGVMAGTAVLLAFCSDLHVFFFSVLALPAWCIVAFAAGGRKKAGNGSESPAAPPSPSYRHIAAALLPTGLLVGAAYLLSRTTARELASATMASGWRLAEVAPHSPHAGELVRWCAAGPVSPVYVGFPAVLLLLAGFAILGFRTAHRKTGAGRSLLVFILLCGAIAGIIMLALGTNGPGAGILLKVCRKLVPPYRMIRQPAKVFCLLPSFLSVACAMAMAALTNGMAASRRKPASGSTGRSIARCIVPLVGLLLLLEYGLPIRSAVCLLAETQEAYRAVAADAQQRKRKPLAMVLPLWPGNSHWSSLYLHHASHYRIRLMNGYRPAVPRDYISDVFKRFESMNQGILTEQQLDNLLERKCGYVIIHEDAFPEKVSPFPVYLTLKRLLEHPRLQLLEQDERIRSFRILPSAPATGTPGMQETAMNLPFLFPSRRWNVNAPIAETLTFQPRAPVGNAPGLRWALLMRGNGGVDYALTVDGAGLQAGRLAVTDSRRWKWQEIEITQPSRFFTPSLALSPSGGRVEVYCCVLNAGPDPGPRLLAGEVLELPAACFFHAGYSDAGLQSVSLLKDKDPARPILYGSMINLPDGNFRLDVEIKTSAPAPAHLGTLRVINGQGVAAEQEVLAGTPAVIEFTVNNQIPLRIEFCYAGSYNLQLGTFKLSLVR